MRRRAIVAALVAGGILAALGIAAFAVAGGDKSQVQSDELTGYQEGAGVSSSGTGSFRARIDDDGETITYELRYSGLSTPATQSHIHFGNRYTVGNISAFLCTNLGNGPAGTPACPPGTTEEAVVTGTITSAGVTGLAASQGIAAGEVGELVRAIRAGVTYANVHTSTFPPGEVRGQINNDSQRQP
jgi:hypothetical protein